MTALDVTSLEGGVESLESMASSTSVPTFDSADRAFSGVSDLWSQRLTHSMRQKGTVVPWGKNEWAPALIALKTRMYDAMTSMLLSIARSNEDEEREKSRRKLEIFLRFNLISESLRGQVASLLQQN